MNKSDIIEMVAKEGNLSVRSSEGAVNALISNIRSALSKGEKMAIAGFGTFSVSKRKARKGRNPKTGEVIEIPSRKMPRFKAGEALRDAVR
ncbi:MAG: HU family DNA-binding protein [Nitrospinae bacterium]|nr:HU family DNA-binding protein [Nitrospinota bacterium]MBI3814873.1 HU family DNA-binding protein [Nitrospinota bacterium]